MLEQWVFSMRRPGQDESAQNKNEFTDTIYNRLCILLKSIVSVSRALPAYKYARNQNCDAYVFLYQVYSHDPASAVLGKEYRSNTVRKIQTAAVWSNFRLALLFRLAAW